MKTVPYVPPPERARRAAQLNGKAPPKPPTFAFLRYQDIDYRPEDERELIEGVLPAEGLAVVYGKQKSKKSFIVLDIAFAVVTPGRDWAGRTTEHGPVVYVACEGSLGMRKRVVAYRKNFDIPRDAPFILVPAKPNLGIAGGDRQMLIDTVVEALGDLKPRLIVLDTLNRTLHGQSENGEAMSSFADNAEAIGEHFKCLALAVHHEPWSGDRMRGHSSLPGAMVVGIRVKKIDGLVSTFTITDGKDIEDGIAFRIAFKQVEVAERVTTLVVDNVTLDAGAAGDDDEAVEKKPQWRRALDVLDICLADHGAEAPKTKHYPSQARIVDVTLFRTACVTYGVTCDAYASGEGRLFGMLRA